MGIDPGLTAVTVATFLIAGLAKGVVGFGLPTIALAILTLTGGLHGAMALLLLPSLITNIWQATDGGRLGALLRRLWPFLLSAIIGTLVGLRVGAGFDPALLVLLMGLLLVLYGVSGLAGWRLRVAARREPVAGPLTGAVNGLLTGLTGSFVVPGVMYLQALGLPRDRLVQAMGILFTISTLALLAALGSDGLLSADLGIQSAIGVPAALLGMVMGRRIRGMLPERRFRQVFQTAILLLGVSVMVSAVGAGTAAG